MEKLNNSNYNGLYSCSTHPVCPYVRYDVLIHSSKETLINDLHTEPIVTMDYIQQGKRVKISKSNLNTIATDENPCTDDEKLLVKTECDLKKVCTMHKLNSAYYLDIFYL